MTDVVIDGLPVRSFATANELEAWLLVHHETSPGIWLRISKAGAPGPSVGFHAVLELGLAYGWSESMRRSYDAGSYLQRFTPRRSRGTRSARNTRIVERLAAEGRMTPAGWRALESTAPSVPAAGTPGTQDGTVD